MSRRHILPDYKQLAGVNISAVYMLYDALFMEDFVLGSVQSADNFSGYDFLNFMEYFFFGAKFGNFLLTIGKL